MIIDMINIQENLPNELTMEEKEGNLTLHEYLVLKEKVNIELLKLDDLNEDFNVKLQKERFRKEIEKLDERIAELGGEKEVSA